MEQWKYIEGTNGKYQVSNYGRIKGENGLISQWVNKSGYMVTHIPNYYGKSTLVHRLVAETFLDNPNGYPQINHKDENKTNNFVFINEDGSVDCEKSNLEYCSAKYNSNYGTRNERMVAKLKGRKPSDNTIKASVERCSRKVSKYSMNEELIETYPSLAEAARQNKGVHHANIIRCCDGSGRLKSTGGFKWKYAD